MFRTTPFLLCLRRRAHPAALFTRCGLGVVLALACLASARAQAESASAPAPQAEVTARAGGQGQVVASGVVPDEATRQAVLSQLRGLYGPDRVVDQLGVGHLVAPPKWAESLQKILSSPIKRISRGEIRIRGNVIEVAGEVENEAVRQQLLSEISTQLNPTYTVRSALRVAQPPQQAQLDSALANRIIEFQPGNALLTPNGQQVLDQLVPVLARFQGRRFEVIGHTDADGGRDANIVLSANRAQAVRLYLSGKGIAPASILTSGAGPDRPVASNDTVEGRARNRRIEFKVLN